MERNMRKQELKESPVVHADGNGIEVISELFQR